MVTVSSVAYGDGGGGIPGLLLASPRDEDGNLIMLGTGQQRWSTVHAADLADFFRRVPEDDSARGRHVIGNRLNPTVADLTEAAAVAAGAAGAVPGSEDEARALLGDYFAEVLLLDRGTSAAKARDQLDWSRLTPGSSTSSTTAVTAESRLADGHGSLSLTGCSAWLATRRLCDHRDRPRRATVEGASTRLTGRPPGLLTQATGPSFRGHNCRAGQL